VPSHNHFKWGPSGCQRVGSADTGENSFPEEKINGNQLCTIFSNFYNKTQVMFKHFIEVTDGKSIQEESREM